MTYLKIRKVATTKVVSIFVGFAMTLSLVGGAAMPAQAATVEELTAQIASLLATISSLQAQLAAMTGGETPSTCGTFTRNLTMGDTGADVKDLQVVLNGSADTQVAASGVGSAGNETEYFGGLTKAAVIKFQNKYAAEILAPVGLTAGTGYVGPSTRAKLNTMCTTDPVDPTDPTDPTPAGTGVTVSSPAQPAASLAPQSVARLPFTKVTITAAADGDVTVDSLTVERTGLGADAVFAGVVLLDEDGTQLGIAKTLNSNHQATVGEAFTVKAGTSKTVTVAGNMASSLATYAGQVVSLSVVSVNTSAAVSGSLPITGANHTVNATLSTGSVLPARGVEDPNTSATKEIGTTGYTFAAVKLTAGSAEKVRVHSIRWNQSGSASMSDLANIEVIFDGTSYPVTVSADGKYYSANFGSGVVIDKGLSKEIKIKGDIVSGSGRTVVFDLYKNTDVYVTGETYGYGITPSGETTTAASDASSQFTTGTPWYDNAVVTVSAGSVSSIAKSNDIAAQNVSILSPNQPFGGFEVEVKGEPVSIQQMVFNVLATGDEAENMTNISLVDGNGSVVAGPVDGASNSTNSADGTVTFTDTVTLPVGKTVLALKGQLGSAFATNDTVQASTTPSTDWTTVTGQTTGNTISLSSFSTAVTGNQMTVKAAANTVTVAADPASKTVVMGQTGFTFANIQFDGTASGEDVKYTSAQFRYTDGGSDPTNCFVYDGSTKLNNTAINPAGTGADTYTFDNHLTVPKGTIKTVALKCDIPASLTAGHQMIFGINSADTISGTGAESGATASLTYSTANSGTMTLAAAGSLTVTKDASSPSYALAAAGSSDVTMGVLKFHAANEDITLEKVSLQLTNTASSSASDIVKVSLYDGSTKVGEAIFTGTNTNATSTLTGSFVIPADGDKLMTVKADLSAIGTGQPGTQGHLIAIDYDGDDTTGTRGTGAASGTAVNTSSTSDTAMSGVRMYRSFPTLTKVDVPTNTLDNGQKSLLRFKVSADSAGDVGLYKVTIRLATTTATVSGLNVYAYTDSGFSTPVSGLRTDGAMLTTDSNATWASSATDLEIVSTAVIQVPAGGDRYFDVKGTVAGAASGASVSTQLQGDAAFPALAGFMDSATNIDGDTNDDFVWSPNATTTSGSTANDWTNGYGISGLPAANMTAEVLSK